MLIVKGLGTLVLKHKRPDKTRIFRSYKTQSMIPSFDTRIYNSNLKTTFIGRPCVYLDSVDTTIDVAKAKDSGSIVVAGRQVRGRGQRNNVWHSPPGCAMASLKLTLNKSTLIATRICFIQHILAVIIAKTLEQLDHNKLGKNRVKLKWPNDIIYIDTVSELPTKIGGILINTTDKSAAYDIVLSFGLNVLNEEPTTSVFNILGPDHARCDQIRTDTIIAAIMNNLEPCIDKLDSSLFQELKGHYVDRCMQLGNIVDDEIHGLVRVREVNDDGYLIGDRVKDSATCTVTRIMNSLDESKNKCDNK